MTGETLAQRFGNWAAALNANAIPPVVTSAARRAILDTVAAMTAGVRHPSTAKAIAAFSGEPSLCRLVNGHSATAAAAALINGVAAHAYDLDDTSYTGIMHGSAVIFPAVLAAIEESDCDDATALAAFVAGSEIAYTLGDIVTHAHYFHGWWSTVTLGVVGAAAAVARVYGLDAEKTAHAIAFAAASAGGGKVVFGTDGKPLFVGTAARSALDFAKAARTGLTGPLDAFENSRGFFTLLAGEAKPDVSASLGQRWRLTHPGLLFKRYPICSAAHALVEQTAALCREAGAGPDRIVTIECHVPSLVDISLVYDDPKSAQQAQFSLPYTAACAAHHGAVTLDDLGDAALGNPAIRGLMRKVVKAVDAELSSDAMRAACPESARVVLLLDDGRRLEGFCGVASGMPTRPLTDDDLKRKFDDCVSFAGRSPAETASARDNLLALGGGGPGNLAGTMAKIWSSGGKNVPIAEPPRLAQGLPDEVGRPHVA